MARRIVGVEPHGAVGADQQEVPGRKGAVGRVIAILSGLAGGVSILGVGRHVGQDTGGDLDADDAGDRVLEGGETGRAGQHPDGEEEAGEDDQPLGPRPP